MKSFVYGLVLFFTLCSGHASQQKIITLAPHTVELIFAIGAGDRIIATTEYSDFPEEALKIPRVGNYNGLQIETIVKLQPDLIVAWKSGNKLNDLQKLESLGLNIHYTDPKNLSELSIDILKLGELTGLVDNAKKLADKTNFEHQSILNKFSGRSKVNVFYQLWHDPIRTVARESWISKMVSDCGGNNIFHNSDKDYPIVSMESIVVKQPQVIIIAHHSGDVGGKKEIWNGWETIPAIKNKLVFSINGDILHRFTPRALQGLQELCESIDKARTL